MVEGRQLSFQDTVHNRLDTIGRRDIRFDSCYSLGGPNVLEKLAGTGLISHHRKDVAPGIKGSLDGGHADVSAGPDNKNGFHG